MEKRFTKDLIVWVSLIALIVVGRYLPHAANFTPAAAAGLFAAYFFRSRLAAVSVPLVGMAVSDWMLNMPYHWATMAVVYAAMCLPALLMGGLLRKEGTFVAKSLRILGGTLAGTVLFFLSTNLAVWLWDGLYALNAAGLSACFTAAIPFFKWNLAGDLGFALILFGGHALVGQWMARRAQVTATA